MQCRSSPAANAESPETLEHKKLLRIISDAGLEAKERDALHTLVEPGSVV